MKPRLPPRRGTGNRRTAPGDTARPASVFRLPTHRLSQLCRRVEMPREVGCEVSMGITTIKGEIGEAMVIADLRKRGFGVAIPFGHDVPFDVILYRKETGMLERVQVKYTESDGKVIRVKCRSASDWVSYRYTAEMIDWIAVYDANTDRCYYVPPSVFDGRVEIRLRLAP